MAAPVIPGGNAVGTAPWTKIMFDVNIMRYFFFKVLLIRKESRPDILDMARQVGRYTVEITRKPFHGATVTPP